MRYSVYSFFIVLFSLNTLTAQQPKKLNAVEIYDVIEKLNTLASVLYVAAHPDDENTRLIAYIANKVKARTAYLSLTRGDGGQNLIGPEIRELLGVIRTQELLAARRVDGGEQRFSRANDFGFSKHPDETLKIWDKDQVLADVVWAIRTFQPDVIINRFDHRTPGTTHGHHTTASILSMEAFDISDNPEIYTSQLKYTQTWQPKRIFFNTSWWFYGSRDKFAKADKSNMIKYDVGVYYPNKGVSNNEIASLASSQHLCQGFGRLAQRGSQDEYIEFLKGESLNGSDDIFEGIDTSWNRIKGGKAIGDILNMVEANFNFKNPASHLPQLMEAYTLLQNIDNNHWKVVKTKALKAIIEACAGLYLEASSNTPNATPSDEITLNIETLNRSNTNIRLEAYKLSAQRTTVLKKMVLNQNKKINFEATVQIPERANYTTPYWLNHNISLGMYRVDNQNTIGKPETSRGLLVDFNLNIEGTAITFTKPVVYRYSKPDKGELYRPFEIIPKVSSHLTNDVYIFDTDSSKDIKVQVNAHQNGIDGYVQMNAPEGWHVYPAKQKIEIAKKNDIQELTFTVIPPNNATEGNISPTVVIGEEEFKDKLIEIDYAHIPFQTVLLANQSKLVRLNIEKFGTNIGYIEGAGDVVPESLRQVGYNVTVIPPENISASSLSQFDAIVVGIRAYNVVDELKFKQKYLLDYVKEGGNLIVQYNTNRRLKLNNIAPFDLQLSRDRVTDEQAEVRILKPEHPILNFPNKITTKDFEGWVQERGLYFPNKWSSEFTPLLAMNDKNESPKEGSLLVAKYGQGHYIYTGLSFFREFPAGVSGAYRLFANLLSAGKTDLNSEIKN